MIGYLSGIVRGNCVVTRDGVGYLVRTPDVLEHGDEVELLIETVVREASITLYGFLDDTTRRLFVALNKVAGVGPVQALSLLSQLGAGAVIAAIAAQDPSGLKGAKGVGAKVAQSILTGTNIVGLETAAIVTSPVTEATRDIAKTLVGLGWKPEQAELAASAALDALPGGSESERLRWAMARMRGDV
jgi:Holliday junction DNA helicase RuvA